MSDTDVTGPSGDIDERTVAAAGAPGGTVPAVIAEGDETAVGADSEEDPDDENDVEDIDEDEEPEDEGDRAQGGRRSRRTPSLKRLEEEGDVAADYLEVLLDITDLDGDIDIDVENGRASVAILAEEGGDRELRRLVGPRGEVLEALQELSRLAVQARTGERSRLMLDVAGFRAARKRALEGVAAKACEEVAKSGQPVRLEPMTAFERKVVHDVVAAASLRSESEGEEPARRVVVYPASV